MTFRQFAFNNIIRNKRTYLAHFFSSTFSVMIFFIYALLQFHPDLQGEIRSSSGMLSILATQGLVIAEVIIFIFSFLFLLYSVGSFLKVRKKEFGIFLILGMSRKQMNRLLFMENLLVGVVAIGVGIVLGMIFSKLILLITASMLVIQHGLPFYFPIQAIVLTAVAFLVMFLVIAALSSLLLGKGKLIDLVKAEDKPKPEPKASAALSLLAVLLIGGGYALVFTFAILQIFSVLLLFAGVALTILGTYFLYTQLSVYVIRTLKRNRKLFFHRINILSISELSYRMKDNAVMFFMVTIVSASAFTGIGTMLATSDPGLSEMENPYAFKYESMKKNSQTTKNIEVIEKLLKQHSFAYRKANFQPIFSDQGQELVKLSEYNEMAKVLGYPEAHLKTGEVGFRTPGTIGQRSDYRSNGIAGEKVSVSIENQETPITLGNPGTETVVPANSSEILVISDSLYDQLSKKVNPAMNTVKYVLYQVEDWKNTRDVTKEITEKLAVQDPSGEYYMESLVDQWARTKQDNGMILIVSGLIGVVFFTFAASFIYFRLYADLERDEQQYKTISKLGLNRSEMNRSITRQLSLMFFLPILLAIVHSAVAFTALQQLIDYSMLPHALSIFAFFASVQIVYYFIIRWRYLGHMYQKIQ